MPTRIFKNKGVHQEVKTHFFWAFKNENGEFYSQFETVHGYTGLGFTKDIRSAATWPKKNDLLQWRKTTPICHYYTLKPIKIKITNTYTIEEA